MAEVETHEALKMRGLLLEFEDSMGDAIFVSHQWVGNMHPDPESKQLRVLQDALTRMLEKLEYIPLDVYTETFLPRTPRLHVSEIRKAPLFIWYDYFSCPQLESGSVW
ncbi:unnamed protein product [Symbiodinium pilosum]|uniref:Uncharacterized protein n=1 Tax=Symbiodinium pilosum TaxID=2952 RepID=A0A812KVR6_SYMPI|nr:unnamed protein product [Symbiodinium pilosum]